MTCSVYPNSTFVKIIHLHDVCVIWFLIHRVRSTFTYIMCTNINNHICMYIMYTTIIYFNTFYLRTELIFINYMYFFFFNFYYNFFFGEIITSSSLGGGLTFELEHLFLFLFLSLSYADTCSMVPGPPQFPPPPLLIEIVSFVSGVTI